MMNNNINELDCSEIARSFECSVEDLLAHFPIKSTDISIFTQNIRSIYKNFSDLECNLTLLKINFDVIVLYD